MVLYCDEIEGTPVGKKVQMMDHGARSQISVHVKKKKEIKHGPLSKSGFHNLDNRSADTHAWSHGNRSWYRALDSNPQQYQG